MKKIIDTSMLLLKFSFLMFKLEVIGTLGLLVIQTNFVSPVDSNNIYKKKVFFSYL